jgi:AbrB family looped-hinge helix DNA binding protein
MSSASLTSKGQTTIPADVRHYLDLHPGDKIEFFKENGRVWIAPLTSDVRQLKGMLPKPKHPISIEDMNAAIKKRGAGHEGA